MSEISSPVIPRRDSLKKKRLRQFGFKRQNYVKHYSSLIQYQLSQCILLLLLYREQGSLK